MKNLKTFKELNEAENPKNLALFHKSEAESRRDKWQKDNAKTKISTGDWVKVAFQDGKEVEHMWVNIKKVIDQNKFEGVLDNEPIIVKNVKLGDPVTVTRSEISQLMKPEN